MSIRVLIVDDQTVVRQALEVMVGMEPDIDVVGVAENGAEAVKLTSELEPAVILMDINMPEMNGIEATEKILKRLPEVKVLILTTFDDADSILSALRAGALGYLTKDADRGKIAQSIRAANSGQSVLEPRVQQRLLDLAAQPSHPVENQAATVKLPELSSPVERLSSLTTREREILELIGLGLRNREIADRLVVTEATVKTHINNLFSKLGLRSRAEAVRFLLSS